MREIIFGSWELFPVTSDLSALLAVSSRLQLIYSRRNVRLRFLFRQVIFLKQIFRILIKYHKKKYYKIWFSQGTKLCQSLSCQNHSSKRHLGTKLPVKPTWSEKMTVLSTFLETSCNFLFNNLKDYKI